MTRNSTRSDHKLLEERKHDSSISILNSDKNLGPVVLDTDWVKMETLRQLHDPKNYKEIEPQDWPAYRQSIIAKREAYIKSCGEHLSKSETKFLRSLDFNSSSPAKFYMIPKIHKEELVGRSITVSCSYITKPISTL